MRDQDERTFYSIKYLVSEGGVEEFQGHLSGDTSVTGPYCRREKLGSEVFEDRVSAVSAGIAATVKQIDGLAAAFERKRNRLVKIQRKLQAQIEGLRAAAPEPKEKP